MTSKRLAESIVKKSDVGNWVQCTEDGPICKSGGNRKQGICYQVTYLACADMGVDTRLFGETGNKARTSCLQHAKALSKRKNSKLWEHSIEVHR